jgi:hypothetical protein
MEYKEAEYIYQVIKSTQFQNLSKRLIKSAVQYAQIRVEWQFASQLDRVILDNERTRSHDGFISNCDALAGNMKKAGEDDSWRTKLGNDRKKIGDFACFVHAIIGIEAR